MFVCPCPFKFRPSGSWMSTDLYIFSLLSFQSFLERQISTDNEQSSQLEKTFHEFYQTQMENIIVEKVSVLQAHVADMEDNLVKEREDALTELNQKHGEEIDKLRARFVKINSSAIFTLALLEFWDMLSRFARNAFYCRKILQE